MPQPSATPKALWLSLSLAWALALGLALGCAPPGDAPTGAGGAAGPAPTAEISLDAWVEVPDSSALIQGRQLIQARWTENVPTCPEVRYRLDVLAGAEGQILAQAQLIPPREHGVEWAGYALSIPDVPVSAEPAHLRISRCCGSRCVSPIPPRPVRTFLAASTWSDLANRAYPQSLSEQRFLGSDGRGTVWIYDPQERRLRYAPLMGPEQRLPLPGADDTLPMGVARAGSELWLITNRGIFSQRSGVWPGTWNDAPPRVPPGMTETRVYTHVFPRAEPEEERLTDPGPCALDAIADLLCYTGAVPGPLLVHRFEGPPPRDGVVAAGAAWFLLRDGRIVALDLTGIVTPGFYPTTTVLSSSQLPEVHPNTDPQVIGVDPDGETLWLGGRQGALWRVSLGPERNVEDIEGPMAWAQPLDELEALAVDSQGRLGLATRRGVGIFTSEGMSLHDRSHGWHADLVGLGWVLPGVLWAGDRFLLTAPTSLPPYGRYYMLAFAFAAGLMVILGVLALLQDTELEKVGLLEGFLRRITSDVGWGAAVVALFLPQALVLAVDRLLSDLSLTPGPIGRVAPVILFVGFFIAGIHRIRSWADVARIAGRRQIPLLVLLVAIWGIHLLLWVWPPHPRTPDFDPTLTLVHLGVALVTGMATLLFFFHTITRMGERRGGG